MKKLIYFCIYLCLLSMLVSCGKSTEQKIQEQLELGQKYLLEQKYEEAVIAFQMVLELDPKNINGYLSLSDVYMEMDSPDLAAQTLKTGIGAYDTDDETDGLNQLKERLVKCRRRQIDSELDDGNYDNAAELYEEMNSYGADEEVLTP